MVGLGLGLGGGGAAGGLEDGRAQREDDVDRRERDRRAAPRPHETVEGGSRVEVPVFRLVDHCDHCFGGPLQEELEAPEGLDDHERRRPRDDERGHRPHRRDDRQADHVVPAQQAHEHCRDEGQSAIARLKREEEERLAEQRDRRPDERQVRRQPRQQARVGLEGTQRLRSNENHDAQDEH
eukprot:1079416-Prymnesium_polylepis.1